MFVIITFVLQLAKRRPSKPMELQAQLLTVSVGNDIDVRLLANTNLVPNRLDHLIPSYKKYIFLLI